MVQSGSYLVLFGWYWAASGKTLYTDLAVVQPSAISLPKDAVLYYMAENNCDIYARDFGSEQLQKIYELASLVDGNPLFLSASRTIASRWDIVVGPMPTVEPPDPNPSVRVVSASLACAVAEPTLAGLRPGGEVPRFAGDKSGWEFYFGWMAGHLNGENSAEGKHVEVLLDTPFVRWPVCHPTQLPSGQVIFQLGRNQICIIDPEERKIALLAKGHSPVVTMRERAK